jgi:hypothetical protein
MCTVEMELNKEQLEPKPYVTDSVIVHIRETGCNSLKFKIRYVQVCKLHNNIISASIPAAAFRLTV